MFITLLYELYIHLTKLSKYSLHSPVAFLKHSSMLMFVGHPCSTAYFKHSKCPYFDAKKHTPQSHWHPFSCAYFKHSTCPFSDAIVHVH